MVTSSQSSFFDHLKISLTLSMGVGSLMSLLVLIGMPFFLDTPLDLVIFCLLIPAVLGVLSALLFFLLQRIIPWGKRSVEKLQLPFAYIISFLLFLMAAFFSGIIYVFVSDNSLFQSFSLLIYLLVWVFILSRIELANLRLSKDNIDGCSRFLLQF